MLNSLFNQVKLTIYDLIYYCDSYPGIGNGHLKRAFDITNYMLTQETTLRVALMGNYSNSAQAFIQKFNVNHLKVLPVFDNKVHAKITMLDTLTQPGDIDTIDNKLADYLRSISHKLFVINTGEKTFVPESVDAIFNYVPITQYYGNESFEKYFGLDYAPMKNILLSNNNVEFIQYDILAVIGGGEKQDGPDLLSAKLSKLINYKCAMIVSPHVPAPQLASLIEKYPKIEFFQNVPSIEEFILKSKIIITTYGNTTYESMALGKGTLVVAYYPFQKLLADYLDKNKKAKNLGFFKELGDLGEIIQDRGYLDELSRNCKLAYSKSGINNIGDILLKAIHNV